VIPTEYVGPDEDRELTAIIEARGWDEAGVKPPVGASSAGVWRTTLETAAADQTRFEEPFDAARRVGDSASNDRGDTLPDRGALVQKFYPEVAAGERSLVLFGGSSARRGRASAPRTPWTWNRLPTRRARSSPTKDPSDRRVRAGRRR
jgi:hypothetical protein